MILSSGTIHLSASVLYVLISPSPLFAGHWSLFLPDVMEIKSKAGRYKESDIGRRFHVSGDRLNGFSLEMVRTYNVKKHRGAASRCFAVGVVSLQHLTDAHSGARDEADGRSDVKDEDEGGGYVDNVPRNAFEKICVEVEAPGPSLNHVSSNGCNRDPLRLKTEAHDCQWWVRNVVEGLVERNVLLPLETCDSQGSLGDPISVVARLPKK